MSDLLHEMEVIPPMDPAKMFDEDYYDEMVTLASSILKNYLPYVSDYNSMVLFSLNGLCPDDNEHGFANNTFSNKKCAVIEPLVRHINQVISLVFTDTAVKGDVYLCDESIILIEEAYYKTLSDKEKSDLKSLGLLIKTFTGSLKEAVLETLKNTGRYIPETLSLSASTGGVMPSKTSEFQKELVCNIASTYGLAQQKYVNLITSHDEMMPKYSEVCNEYRNMIAVQEYFMTMFLEPLFIILNAPENMKNNISGHYIVKLLC